MEGEGKGEGEHPRFSGRNTKQSDGSPNTARRRFQTCATVRPIRANWPRSLAAMIGATKLETTAHATTYPKRNGLKTSVGTTSCFSQSKRNGAELGLEPLLVLCQVGLVANAQAARRTARSVSESETDSRKLTLNCAAELYASSGQSSICTVTSLPGST